MQADLSAVRQGRVTIFIFYLTAVRGSTMVPISRARQNARGNAMVED
jgi:hypothetical protein